jgi:flagellar biogenesis protein FliO
VGVGLIETVGVDVTAIVGFVTLVVWLLMQLVRRRGSRRG